MTAFEHIDPSIPFLKTTDTVEKGLDWMEEYKLFNLPVVGPKSNKFLGLVSETVLINEEGKGLLIKDIPFHSEDKTVKLESHIYDALAVIGSSDLDIVPVVDSEHKFLGLLTTKELINCVAKFSSISTHGGIVELMMSTYDYSMVEIARAVESNGAKILSSYISTIEGEVDKIKVLIKLNISDLSLVVAEFQQLNYVVTALYTEYEPTDNTETNYRHLFKYLDL